MSESEFVSDRVVTRSQAGGVNVIASGVYKGVAIIASGIVGGRCDSRIKIWKDARAELGSLMVWTGSVVDLLADELY